MMPLVEDSMQLKSIWIVVGAVLVSGLAMAENEPEVEKRAFEISDYYRTAVVGAPSLTPVGEGAAFAVGRHDLVAGESWSEIWLLGSDGKSSKQLTFGKNHDSNPIFSPDGKTLMFSSDRDGESQLWVMALDGGEPRRLTGFPGGISDPVFSPDGRFLAVTAEVYPECGGDGECNQTIRDAIEKSPLEVHMADQLLYRHWTSWRDGKYAHILLLDAKTGSVLRDLTPGKWDSPVFGAQGGVPYAFSPDSNSLCFVSNRDQKQAESTNADLFLIPVDSDGVHPDPKNLTSSNRGFDGNPRFSPDGQSIAFLSQETPGYESDLIRLAVLDLASGKVRYLTDRNSFDNWADDMQWMLDSKTLIFQAEVGGRTPLYRIASSGGAAKLIHADAAIKGWGLEGRGDSILYTASGIGRPPELYRIKESDDAAVRLTYLNADIEAEVDIRPPEEMMLEGDGGKKIHVWIVKPHGFDPSKKYPLIINVHGGPQMQWKDRYRGDWQVYPGKGYVVAFPNPTGSAGFGQDLVDGIACDWSGEVFRDLEKVSDQLAALPWVDEDRMGAMGWSWGGYMMMYFESHTTRFKALASMMGVYDLRSMYSATEELWFPEHDLCGPPWENAENYRKWSPSTYVKDYETPCLVITGERDYRVPYTQSLQFFTDLQKQGVPSRLVVFPKSGHWPSWYEMAFYYTVHLEWFEQWLGGEGPPWSPEAFIRGEVFEETSEAP
ncbi:MAG: S9 family peptidase [Acidobacteria bacterium]|nr:MAG: S9 family peptidase [Acidobacteriota bacterium]